MHISLIESTAYEWWWKMCPCWKAIYSVTAGGIYFALWAYIDSVYCSVDFPLTPPLFILCLLKSFHPAASYISQHSMKESEKKVECSLMFLYCSDALHRLDRDLLFFFSFFFFLFFPFHFWQHSTWAYQEGSSWPQLPPYCSVPRRTAPFRESFRAAASEP